MDFGWNKPKDWMDQALCFLDRVKKGMTSTEVPNLNNLPSICPRLIGPLGSIGHLDYYSYNTPEVCGVSLAQIEMHRPSMSEQTSPRIVGSARETSGFFVELELGSVVDYEGPQEETVVVAKGARRDLFSEDEHKGEKDVGLHNMDMSQTDYQRRIGEDGNLYFYNHNFLNKKGGGVCIPNSSSITVQLLAAGKIAVGQDLRCQGRKSKSFDATVYDEYGRISIKDPSVTGDRLCIMMNTCMLSNLIYSLGAIHLGMDPEETKCRRSGSNEVFTHVKMVGGTHEEISLYELKLATKDSNGLIKPREKPTRANNNNNKKATSTIVQRRKSKSPSGTIREPKKRAKRTH